MLAVPIDHCADELFEGGCYNHLVITGNPVVVNANGTSYVGVEAFTEAREGCQADVFPKTERCDGGYCHNGGSCSKDSWGTLTCECLPGYAGPRCQQTSHHFDGKSVAHYPPLEQCEDSSTSLDFITDKVNL